MTLLVTCGDKGRQSPPTYTNGGQNNRLWGFWSQRWLGLCSSVSCCTCLFIWNLNAYVSPDFHRRHGTKHFHCCSCTIFLNYSNSFFNNTCCGTCQLFRLWSIFSVGIVNMLRYKSLCLTYFSLFFLSAREGKKQVSGNYGEADQGTEWMIMDWSKCGRSWREGARSSEWRRSR
jgi:hypothetical protein